jgi:hypothetical protein
MKLISSLNANGESRSMPAFLEHSIDWTDESKAPTTLPPIQPTTLPPIQPKAAVPSTVPQVGISELTTPEPVAPPLGEETPPMVEETRNRGQFVAVQRNRRFAIK